MEINNFELIRPLLKFDSEDDFYHCQIMKRKKEHPELGSNSYVIKTYYIKSIESLMFYIEEMKIIAKNFDARVYINLNRRSFEKIAFHTLRKVADIIMNKDWKSVQDAYNSVCGTYSNEIERNWILDVDDDLKDEDELIGHLHDIKPIGDKVLAKIPTKNGYHLITKPFWLSEFHDDEVYIHKDNPTILYIP